MGQFVRLPFAGRSRVVGSYSLLFPFFLILGTLSVVSVQDLAAECSSKCKRIKKAAVIGLKGELEYLQRGRDLLVVRNARRAKADGFVAATPCLQTTSYKNSAARRACAPAILSVNDSVYFCPHQVRPFRSIERAESLGFSAYTSCGNLAPLPSPAPTSSVSPIPNPFRFVEDAGIRISDIDSAHILPLRSGGFRMYFSPSNSSFVSDTIYFSDSVDGLVFSAPTSVTGIAPERSDETLANPTVLQFADNSFQLIYERIRHISSAAVDVNTLFRGVSADGGNFARSPADSTVIEQGSSFVSNFSADVVEIENGMLRMYYTQSPNIISETSSDNGNTWQQEGLVTIEGISDSYAPYPSEVNIVSDGSGAWLMFFTSPVSSSENRILLFSAQSSDGRNFTVHNTSLVDVPEGISISHPSAVRTNSGLLRVYYVERTGSLNAPIRSLKSILED